MIIMALITSKNKPNVSTVIGNENNFSNGLTNTLSNPKTTATIREFVMPSTVTPVIKCEISNTNPAVIINLSIIIYFLLKVRIILKTQWSLQKIAKDFLHEANVQHLE